MDKIYASLYPRVSTTTSSGATTTLNDTVLTAGLVDNDYLRAWVAIVETVTSGPAYGEVSRVTNQGSGTLTLSPALSATIQSGTDYELHPWFHPSVINDRLDDVIESIEYPIILPLTYLTNGSFESGVTDWTGTNAAIAAETTIVRHGRGAGKVTLSAANGYAESGSLYFPPSTPLFVETEVYVTEGDKATLTLWDKTNDVIIEYAEAVNAGWSVLEINYMIPADCQEVAVRIGGVANGDVLYFDHVCLYPTNDTILPVPSEVDWSADFRRIVYYPRGVSVMGTDSRNNYRGTSKTPEFYSHFEVDRDETAVVPYRLALDKPTCGDKALWVVAKVDYPAFAGATFALKDADTTKAPKDLVVGMTAADLFDMRADYMEERGKEETAQRLRNRAIILRQTIVDPILRGWQENYSIVNGALS